MTAAALTLIVAHDRQRLIGRDGDLPWRLPRDLRRFKALTLGHTVLMGRRTWESLPRRPLPQRHNRVLTRDADYPAEGAERVQSLDAALAPPPEGELFVIGGAALYAACLPRATRLEVTLVHAELAGDTYFPAYDAADFREVFREDHPADAEHAHPYSFLTFERRHAW